MTEERLKRFRSHRKHFFILSTAGKPIYSFHGSDSLVIPHLGAISAMISSFSSTATHDTLQSFSTPTTLFSILPLPPLYLLAISSVPYETPHHLSSQMSLLHSQILSTLTQPTLVSAFKNRSNFDLRRLLGGTETFLQSLCQNLPRSTSHLLNNALSILHLRATHRKTLHSLLLTHRAPSLLYGLILAPHQLIAVLRPTRHSLHPSDLQLLFNMLFNTPSFHEIGTEHWIPLCLPKFNSKGFLHVYICFFARDLCVVLVSADREGFYELREMREKLVRDMVEKGLLAELQDKVKGYANPVGKVLRHWVVKERGLVQITMPRCRGKRRRKKRRKKSGAERGGEESAAEEARDDTKEEEKDDDDDDNDTVKEHNSNSNNINNRDPDPNPDSPSDSDSDYDTSSRFVPIWRQLWSQVHPQANPGGGSSKGKVAFITISSSPSPSPSSASSSDLETITTTQRHALLHITANYEIYAVGRRGRSKEEIVAAAREVLRWVRREEERVWVMSGATF